VYYFGAKPSKKDQNQLVEPNFNPEIKLMEEGENVYLQVSFSPSLVNAKTQLITSDVLGKAKIPKARFENPDGSDFRIDLDYMGNKRLEAHPTAGPFEKPESGSLKLKIW
jgi:hypothetical protein